MLYYLPIALVVISNVFYHLFQKMIPDNVNPVLSLIITYVTAAILCMIILPWCMKDTSLAAEIRKINWTSFALGASIIGLELGFLLAYRAGWNISVGALVANTIVSLLLIPIGLLIFKETLSVPNVVGIILGMGGLILINFR
ncbi:MAG TPA: EamA family transporter [Syntrophomonadaceae bacterium]|nr:EamA family transporter [Syntrophomonadaceae bacterium]